MMENRKICPRPRLSNRRWNLHNPLYKDFIWNQLRVHSPHIHIHSLYAVYSAIQFPFLPRDATRYATAVYAVVVCLSVCPSVTSRYCTETTGRIELFWGMEASFHLSHTVLQGSPKIIVLPSVTLSQTPDLENIATATRSRCQQNPSSSTSTV